VVDVLSICAFYGSAEPFAGIQTFVMRQTRFSPLNGAMPATTILLALSLASLAGAQEVQQASPRPKTPHLSLDQVLSKLEERNMQRSAALQQFEGKRVYRIQYRGFFRERDAEMVVKVHFTAPDKKQFTIVSQTGSKFVIDHVFKKLLDAEQEAAKGNGLREMALTRENYDFTLVDYQPAAAGGQYVLTLTPKTKNKYLYRGKICVDAKDFAVVRIEGEPNRNPSMWISKTDFAHRYTKVDDFWLPAENHTETSVRFGGKSTLSIEYQDYKIVKASPIHIIEAARASDSSLPPPLSD
jgi:outer membrane lipoprotein-sorting protein